MAEYDLLRFRGDRPSDELDLTRFGDSWSCVHSIKVKQFHHARSARPRSSISLGVSVVSVTELPNSRSISSQEYKGMFYTKA